MPGLVAKTFGEGKAVVLLHAFPLDGRIWVNLARELAGHCKVIVPDLRGFGDSPRADEDEITIDAAADEVRDLLIQQGIERAVIGGISRGGYVALAFARRYPEMTEALIALDTRANPADDKERANWAETVERIGQEGLGFLPNHMKDRLFSAQGVQQKPELFDEVRKIILEQDPASVAAAARGMANRSDARPALAELKVPLLAIAGTEDKAFDETRAIAAQVAGAEFVSIPGAGHLAMVEQPEAVLRAMLDFLKRISG